MLEQADKGNMNEYARFIAQSVERSLDIYLKVIPSKLQKSEKLFTLSKLSLQTPYSSKYLNLLARIGKLESTKQGRVWMTSIEAVDRYIKERKRNRKL